MERERNFDNDGLETHPKNISEERKKIMMRRPISLQKNQNHHITRSKEKFKILNTKCREIKFCKISL